MKIKVALSLTQCNFNVDMDLEKRETFKIATSKVCYQRKKNKKTFEP